MFCTCNAYNLESKNNSELTRYLVKYQIIQEIKYRKESRSKIETKENIDIDSKKNNLQHLYYCFLDIKQRLKESNTLDIFNNITFDKDL